MKRLKKIGRLWGLILIIALASAGIGFGGGVPIPPSNKKEGTIEIRVELTESEDNNTKTVEFGLKQ